MIRKFRWKQQPDFLWIETGEIVAFHTSIRNVLFIRYRILFTGMWSENSILKSRSLFFSKWIFSTLSTFSSPFFNFHFFFHSFSVFSVAIFTPNQTSSSGFLPDFSRRSGSVIQDTDGEVATVIFLSVLRQEIL